MRFRSKLFRAIATKKGKLKQRKPATKRRRRSLHLREEAIRIWTRVSPFWKAIAAVAVFLGLASSALSFLPRISVVVSDPVDPSNPFSASFTITNNSFIPLRQVDVSLGIGQVVTTPAQLNPNFVPSFQSRLTKPEWQNHRLTMDERFTITPADIFALGGAARLSGADIAVVVSYKPWLLPFRREKVFRFHTRQQTNGQLYWYSLPLH